MPEEPKRPLKVFLCHAHDDKAKTRELYRYLRRRGIQPWLDAENLVGGQDWRVEIPKAIKTSDAIIICLSKNSINKEGFVQAEITFALEKALEIPPGRIFIIPARFEECEVPDTLERFHYVDLFEKNGFSKLMKSLKTRAGELERTPVEVPRPDEASPNLGSTSEDDKKKEQELELQNLESQAVQFELMGDFWSASKTWYEIKRIDSRYPRADIKIRELEEEIIRERAERQKAQELAREQAERSRAERQAAREKLRSQAVAFLKILGFIGVVIALIWGGTLAVPAIGSWLSTVKTATTQPSATNVPLSMSTPTSVQINDDKNVQMVLVQADEFMMGRDTGFSNERPAHMVYLDVFYIDKYEVTNALYKVCVDEGECQRPINTFLYYLVSREDHPVVTVTWSMAIDYCQWRGASLPTEAQWEKAARGKDERPYPWGEQTPIAQYANYKGNDTKDVGSYPFVKSPYGVFDLAGNVSEWVADWFSTEYYQTVFLDNISNPVGPTDSPYQPSHNFYGRVIRGGSWRSTNNDQLSTTFRNHANPDSYADDLGFRCAKDAP